jgi:integrase
MLYEEVMNHLANSLTIKPQMRMLFILCGATGLRLGEALGIRLEKILDGGSRIIIDQKAWRGEIHGYSREDQKSKCPIWCRLQKFRSHFSFSSCTQSCTQTSPPIFRLRTPSEREGRSPAKEESS